MKVVDLTQYRQLVKNDIEAKRYAIGDFLLSVALAMYDTVTKDNPSEVLVVCGNSYNGQAGLLLADLLKKRSDIPVKIACFSITGKPYEKLVMDDHIEIIDDLRKVRDILPACTYVVDCIFGGELDETVFYPYTYLIGWINSSKAYKLSCDIPSGMNADNGQDFGCVIKADATVTMSVPKIGFYLYPGNINAGNLIVASSAISQESIDAVVTPYSINSLSQIKEKLPVRYKHSYKGSYGKVLLIAGCKETAGASILCGKAIMRSGAGLLTIMSHKEVLPVLNMSFPEAMAIEIDDYNVYYQLSQMDFNKYDLIVIGPGLGRYSDTEELLIRSLSSNRPVVVDADGLFFLKKHMNLLKREYLTVITPHIGEYSRIFDYNEKTIISDLMKINRDYPNLAVVLKGENTLIAYREHITVNTTGNNALAKGGSGDVLAGVIGGLLAQKNDIDSVIAGVYVHSLAADYYIESHSQYSLLASDLIEMIDKVLLKLVRYQAEE